MQQFVKWLYSATQPHMFLWDLPWKRKATELVNKSSLCWFLLFCTPRPMQKLLVFLLKKWKEKRGPACKGWAALGCPLERKGLVLKPHFVSVLLALLSDSPRATWSFWKQKSLSFIRTLCGTDVNGLWSVWGPQGQVTSVTVPSACRPMHRDVWKNKLSQEENHSL